MSDLYDVAIIGAGILGAMTAWKLSGCGLRVIVLDRAEDVGEGSTKANSGILYPGIHPRGGSLKGISCVQGNGAYDEICRSLNIPMKRIGSLYVSFHEEGRETLEKRMKRGKKNGVPVMELLSGGEARRMEPMLSRKVLQALYTPNTAVISPFRLVMALAEAAVVHGVTFRFGEEVIGLEAPGADDPFTIHTNGGDVSARFLVNTAGEHASRVEQWVCPQDLLVRPRRGQFYLFDRQELPALNHVIFQAQEKDEGGTLVAPTVEGNLIAGPTSENVRSEVNTDTTRDGLAHVERVAKKILPELDMGRVITNFAGIRANISNVEKEKKDFVLRRSTRRMVSAVGIKNPGMTSAPYLTDRILNLLREDGLCIDSFDDGKRPAPQRVLFLEASPADQAEMLRRDPRYGRVICRCENITEGDVRAVLNSPLPPRTFNGFKKRLRIGMGRCQGSYCTSRLLKIVCQATGQAPQDFLKSTRGSSMVKGWLK